MTKVYGEIYHSLPSRPDIKHTDTPFGIITNGSKSTIYMNGRNECISSGGTMTDRVRSVIMDRDCKTAVIVDGVWSPEGSMVGRVESLNYDQTLARLSDWDMKWKSLNEIPRSGQKDNNLIPFNVMTEDGYFIIL